MILTLEETTKWVQQIVETRVQNDFTDILGMLHQQHAEDLNKFSINYKTHNSGVCIFAYKLVQYEELCRCVTDDLKISILV